MTDVTPENKINFLVERLSSPITGSFLIAWLGWNWDIILYFIDSELTAKSKIAKISGALQFSTWFLYPAISTLLYIALLPWLTEFHKRYTDKMKIREAILEAKTRNDIKIYESYSYASAIELNNLLLVNFGQSYMGIKQNCELLEKTLNSNLPPLEITASAKDILPRIKASVDFTGETLRLSQEASDFMRTSSDSQAFPKLQNTIASIKLFFAKIQK